MSTAFATLEDAVSADAFPEVDVALRRGRHIGRDDAEQYTFLIDAQAFLEPFYRRFGCELVHKSDGYFYLLPTSDKLAKRHLSSGEMLVGQALTLLYLDPAAIEGGGLVTRDQVLSQLAGVMGTESLLRAMNPKKRRLDERVAQETTRNKVGEALRSLATLGFVELVEPSHVRLRPSLLRFAEPLRGTAAPEAALERLVAEGELVLTEKAAGPEDADDPGNREVEDADPPSDAADAPSEPGSDAASSGEEEPE
jgi:chromosome partition protein MukE